MIFQFVFWILVKEICDYMLDLGWGPYQNDHEDANGQFEMNWEFDDAMATADYVTWMQRGLDLPLGAAGREEHLHMFRTLEIIRREHSGHDAGAG